MKKAASSYFQAFREMTVWKEDDSWITKTGKVLLDILGVLGLIAFSPFLLFALIVAFLIAL